MIIVIEINGLIISLPQGPDVTEDVVKTFIEWAKSGKIRETYLVEYDITLHKEALMTASYSYIWEK